MTKTTKKKVKKKKKIQKEDPIMKMIRKETDISGFS